MPSPPRRPHLHPGQPRFRNSGRFTPTLIAVLSAALLALAWERGRGNVHRLTTAILPGEPTSAHPTGPGGEDAVQLTRAPDAANAEPQFLHAILLPGRGMNLLQLTAFIPGHGELPLLLAPPLDTAAAELNGTGPDLNGSLSATMGAAVLVPWAGRLTGTPSSTPGQLQTLWLGQHLTFPAAAPGSSLSTPGLLLDRAADSRRIDPLPDGQRVQAVFHPGTFSGNWTSTGAVTVTAELAAQTLDLIVKVENTGPSAMPVGIGWLPFFAIPGHNRAQATLSLSADTRLETSRASGLPTGRLVPVTGTPLDFSRPHALGATALDDTFTHFASNPAAELRYPASGFGLRLIPLSANLKALHVLAPPGQPWIALGSGTNLDDPLGPEWTSAGGSGIRTLQPGESLEFKLRLEIFSLHMNNLNEAHLLLPSAALPRK